MRQPRQHVNEQTGDVYYRVRYRHEGKQRALPFYGPDAHDEATAFCSLLDTLGADRAVAWWNAHLEDDAHKGITLADWWTRYLASLTGITEGTRITYQRTFTRVWEPALGTKPLASITREDVAHVVNQLSTTKSDKTVRNAYGVLSSCLKVAASDGLIPGVPSRGIRLPRRTEHTDTEMRFLTYAEWERLLSELPKHYRPLFTTLIGTGIRWGEAEALTVGDYIPGVVATLRVNKAAKWNASKATRDVGPTKTRKSRRTVTLPDEVVDALEPLVRDRKSGERLFLAPKGGALRHRTVYDEWKAAVERANLDPQPRIHDLRHTHVSWLIAQGIPMAVIQARLGHEHYSTTADVYGHLQPDLQIAAAEAASVAMRPRTPPELG